jgi:hypothetical protein
LSKKHRVRKTPPFLAFSTGSLGFRMKGNWIAFVASLLGVAGVVLVIFKSSSDPLAEHLAQLPKNAEACGAQGGAWDQFGTGYFFCRLSTKDANKECTNSAQCQGVCLAASTDGNTLRHNACSSEVMLHGCFTEFSNGKLRTICQD